MQHFHAQTRSAFLWSRFLSIPFWALFNILPVILYKDLNGTPFQIAAIIALKPISSLFSPYWSLSINRRQDKLVSNLVWANILKYVPFLFFPWISNNWIFIGCFGVYMVLARGVIPAWMEIFKLNIQGVSRERVFAVGSVLDYVGTALLPLAFGWILDDYQGSWRWLFVLAALIGIASTLFLFRISVEAKEENESGPEYVLSWSRLVEPWRQSWNLLKQRPDFADFQIGFMLGGAGLMMIQTALPMFFVDTLNLSYTEISLAIIVCKGIGYALSSPVWVKWFQKMNIYRFCSLVTLLAASFPLILLFTPFYLPLLYVGYLIYGIMQSGSELSWHMSGPHFARHEDSSIYSSTNVLSVGIRGCIAPLVGNLMYTMTNSVTVLVISALFCLFATERMRYFSKAAAVPES